MRARVLLLLAGCFLLTVASLAAQQPSDPDDYYLPETDQTPRMETVVGLTRLIDLWHDATLKGDSKLIRQRKYDITLFLTEDIEAARWRYNVCLKRAESVTTLDSSQIAALSGPEQRLLDDLARADQWLKVKKRLLNGFRNTDTFATQYRQITDYRDILRMEYDQWRVQMADSDSPEDADNK